jgi:hypothetical protein
MQHPQVIPFPNSQPHMAPNGQYLPAFPVLANTVDQYATRVPWYAWLAIGAFLAYKFIRTPKGRI